MLDRRTGIILRRIDFFCSDGNYHIIDSDELLSALSPNEKLSSEALKDIITYLAGHDYITIKYCDGKTYCVRPLPAGKIYLERTEQKRKEYSMKYIYPFFPSFLGAFVGAFLAALIIIALVKR